MKFTKKQINTALPRLDTMRRSYRTTGEMDSPAWTKGVPQTMRKAVADCDGDTIGIYIYAVGEAMPESHYYGGSAVVDISEIISEALTESVSRAEVVSKIQNAVNS